MDRSEYLSQIQRVAADLRQAAAETPRPTLRLVGRDAIPDEIEGPAALPDWTTFAPIDVSDRARKMHSIMAIANAHGWQIAVTHFLLTKSVPYLSDLTDPQIDDLLDRMHGYVDAAETGCSLEHYLPAS